MFFGLKKDIHFWGRLSELPTNHQKLLLPSVPGLRCSQRVKFELPSVNPMKSIRKHTSSHVYNLIGYIKLLSCSMLRFLLTCPRPWGKAIVDGDSYWRASTGASKNGTSCIFLWVFLLATVTLKTSSFSVLFSSLKGCQAGIIMVLRRRWGCSVTENLILWNKLPLSLISPLLCLRLEEYEIFDYWRPSSPSCNLITSTWQPFRLINNPEKLVVIEWFSA